MQCRCKIKFEATVPTCADFALSYGNAKWIGNDKACEVVLPFLDARFQTFVSFNSEQGLEKSCPQDEGKVLILIVCPDSAATFRNRFLITERAVVASVGKELRDGDRMTLGCTLKADPWRQKRDPVLAEWIVRRDSSACGLNHDD